MPSKSISITQQHIKWLLTPSTFIIWLMKLINLTSHVLNLSLAVNYSYIDNPNWATLPISFHQDYYSRSKAKLLISLNSVHTLLINQVSHQILNLSRINLFFDLHESVMYYYGQLNHQLLDWYLCRYHVLMVIDNN